jgi:ankyrin repeat protein
MEYSLVIKNSKKYNIIREIFLDYFPSFSYDKSGLKKAKKIQNSENNRQYECLIQKLDLTTFLLTGEFIYLLLTYNRNNLFKKIYNYGNFEVADQYGGNILFMATELNKVDILKWLIDEKKLDITKTNKYNETILFYAIKENHYLLTKWLIDEKKMNVNLSGYDDNNLMCYICTYCNNTDFVQWFITNTDIDLTYINKYGENPLLGSIGINNKLNRKMIKYFVSNKYYKIDSIDTYGYNILHKCSEINDVEFLVDEMGMDINNISIKTGYNILFSAISSENKLLIKWLVNEKKFTFYENTKDKKNILKAAIKSKNPIEIISWILKEFKLDINYKDKLGYNLILSAAQNSNIKLIKWLIRNTDIDYKAVNYMGFNIIEELIYANKNNSKFNKIIVNIKWLLDNTDLSNEYRYIYSLLNYKEITDINKSNILLYINNLGFNINSSDKDGNTLLLYLLIHQYPKQYVAWLLSIPNIDVNHKNKSNMEALNYVSCENRDIFKNILDIKNSYQIKTEENNIKLKKMYREILISNSQKNMSHDSELSNKLERKNQEIEKLEAYISKLKLQILLLDKEPEEF